MTYEEFNAQIKEINEKFQIVETNMDGDKSIYVRKNNDTLIVVSREEICSIDTAWWEFGTLQEEEKIKLFSVCSDLAITPIEKRTIINEGMIL